MKLVEKLKKDLVGNILTNEEIDSVLENEKYIPVESDDEEEEGILKYSNGKSQLWIKYIREEESYLVSDVTMRTKKRGKTTVHAFRNTEDIKKMMDYFRNNEQYDNFLTFVLGLFLARRVGDTLSLKWSDFYYENGNRKDNINTLVEQKTDKMIDIAITDVTWKYIDWYCEKIGINPIEHLHEDIFQSSYKNEVENYDEAIKKQAAKYRYNFKKAADYNGIKGVSTHSTRKTFVYIAHQINKFDPDNWQVLKTITGHEDIETLKKYADIMNEKGQKYYNDVGKYVEDIDNGIKPVIDNTPIVALKTNDLRDILKAAYQYGRNYFADEDDPLDIMNRLLNMVDRTRIS